MKIDIPQFGNRKELFEWLRENKSLLIKSKKSEMKIADGVGCSFIIGDENKMSVTKSVSDQRILETDLYKIKPVINTTNILDSHLDVHIPGLWKKNLKESNDREFLQEHVMKLSHVISEGDDVKAFTQTMTWKELGFDYQGNTEALIFDVTAQRKRNQFMAEQYANGWVKNHSVGMQYVKLFFAINSESKWDKEEKAVWDKYYPQIINQDMADQYGFFWAVLEAKALEGSAVVRGSNKATPVFSINAIEPSDDTQGDDPNKIEPPTTALDYEKLTKCFTINS